eukprot:CAMPEP_0168546700 /NCGR_PEP_ID=MMETSP0413-20121227/3638_1 /TAXON_ID=136452 /ORGANISM="Filamoeba nolandi, Strain NC-AS-23-1" /LENGTH=850 /DNA_ID=CAMNT_0008576895 /DNA_START=93 /DNA_END=2645 /DNA_ORIENTATION=+
MEIRLYHIISKGVRSEVLASKLKKDWRLLGEQMEIDPSVLDEVSLLCESDPNYNPASKLLVEWQRRELSDMQIFLNEVTANTFLEILERTGQEEAVNLIKTWVMEDYGDLEVLIPEEKNEFPVAELDQMEEHNEDLISKLDNLGPWKWLKLFLVGDAGAGKSSVLRWLTGQEFDPTPSNTDSADVTTTDVGNWKRDTDFETEKFMADCYTAVKKQKVTSAPLPFVNQNQIPLENVSPAVPDSSEDNSQEEDEPFQEHEEESFLSSTTSDLIMNNKYRQQLKDESLPLRFQVWDFGGQEVYYNTHHFFLSEAAIYLLIVDITRPVEQIEERIKFWLRSIRSYAPEAPIIIMATHLDQISDEEHNQKMFAIWQQYKEVVPDAETGNCFAVSCKSDELLHETREHLSTTAKEKINLNYPLRWMLFYRTLKDTAVPHGEWPRISDNNNNVPKIQLTCIKLKDVEGLARLHKIEKSALLEALAEFHKLGFILYYPKDEHLSQTIFTKPQELVDALRTVITVPKRQVRITANVKNIFRPGSKQKQLLNDSFQTDIDEKDLKEGKLTGSRMQRIWSQYSSEVRLQLQALLQRFELAVPDPRSKGDFLVPCLVESQAAEDQDQKNFPMLFTYKISVAPPLGVLSRSIVKALNLAMTYDDYLLCRLFRNGCTFKVENGIHVRMDVGVDTVEVRLETVADKNMLLNFLTDMDKFFEEEVAKFTRRVQCTTCRASFEGEKWKLCCRDCTYKSVCSKISTKTRLESLLNSVKRLKELCRILDGGDCWKHFAAHNLVGASLQELDRLEMAMKADPKFSPSGKILRDWMLREQATISNFLEIMKEINCHSAVEFVEGLTRSNQN